MRVIKKIYLHCSDSSFGDLEEINWWHKLRRFSAMFRNQYEINTGYHFIILNGDTVSGKGDELKVLDGSIEVGRRVEQVGAHVSKDNAESIGICMIGKRKNDGTLPFTVNQIYSSFDLILELLDKYKLTIEDVYGHYEWYVINKKPIQKDCPQINMDSYRIFLESAQNNIFIAEQDVMDMMKEKIFK